MSAPATTSAAVLLIDAPALIAHAYRSVPPTPGATGAPTNAVSGFLTTLLDVLAGERPEQITVVFDGAGPGVRAQTVPSYRAHHTPPELAGQIPVLRELLGALQIPVIQAPIGREAGDLIASIAAWSEKPVAIVSTDERILQCVTETTTVLCPAPGRGPDRLTPEAIRARHGVSAAAFVDYLTLRGDRRRGLLPVPGVGDRTAAAWLAEAGSLDTLLGRLDDRSRISRILGPHAATVTTRRSVMRFATDLPAPAPEDMTIPTLTDRVGIAQQFEDLQMPGLAATALAVLGGPEPGETPTHHIGPGQLPEWLHEHASGPGRHALAVLGDPHEILGVAISTPSGATGYLEPDSATEADRTAFGAWLADPDVHLAVHDSKALIHAVRGPGWAPAGIDLDIALAGYLLDPAEGDYSLTALAARYLRIGPHSAGALEDPGTLFATPAASAEPASARAARLIARLAEVLVAELARVGMSRLHTEIELPTAAVLAAIEDRGVAADTAQLTTLRTEFTGLADAATDAAAAVLGRPINLGSTPQLQKALFEDLALPRTRRIKSGYSTAADELTRLLQATAHPFVQHLLDFRTAAKLASIAESLLTHVGADGRLHSTLAQTVVTGRLSSASPNLQNIPIRTAAGARIREGVVPGDGYNLLLTADYSQIEMRIMAHASGDRHLIDAFTAGEDMHSYVASVAFGTSLAEVTPELRRRAKAISYGLAYGQSVRGLATELAIPLAEASDHYAEYFERFGRVRTYLDGLVEQARNTGYTETLFGRRRYLPALTSSNPREIAAAERAALNAPIQGTAADIIKLAMIRIDTAITTAGLRARMILQIHDELLFELPAEELPALTEIVHAIMPTVVELALPLEVSVGTGINWARAHP